MVWDIADLKLSKTEYRVLQTLLHFPSTSPEILKIAIQNGRDRIAKSDPGVAVFRVRHKVAAVGIAISYSRRTRRYTVTLDRSPRFRVEPKRDRAGYMRTYRAARRASRKAS